MHKKIITILAWASVVGSLYGDIELAQDLTVEGFIYLGYDDNENLGDDSSDKNGKIKEAELAFEFVPVESPISAKLVLSFEGGEANFGKTYVNYAFSDSLSVSAGRILSYMGWEPIEPAKMYQNSYAYRNLVHKDEEDGTLSVLNQTTGGVYEKFAERLAVNYVKDQFSTGLSIADGEDGDISLELAGKLTSIENVTVFGMVAMYPDHTTFNTWASYSLGGLTLAAEYINKKLEDIAVAENLEKSIGYLLMANYAFESGLRVTIRYSSQEDENYDGSNAAVDGDFEQITLSPSYVFSDNLLGMFEVSQVNLNGDSADSYLAYGVNLVFTF